MRMFLVPFFIVFFKRGMKAAALIFALAIVTDFLDGLIARLTDSRSDFGAMLDPLADKILICTAFILFASRSMIPDWMVATIISRDAVLILAWITVFIVKNSIKVEVNFAGKLTTFFESTVVLLLLLGAPAALTGHCLYITVALAVVSMLIYIGRGIKKFG